MLFTQSKRKERMGKNKYALTLIKKKELFIKLSNRWNNQTMQLIR